ncbi:hypothetical protein [Chitinophaga silvisoli]|uniref:Uncharacterized protein n=1 Tax=Chitinophaga silvisoli TaxID=2291814 RepID=A0A3E1NWN7_9BACT|nr:hypothetical protein [Chitinophaga silvisoli]RFM32335.1 hypothetical protein DXN04_21855 [Chitinophaga silvisoli]
MKLNGNPIPVLQQLWLVILCLLSPASSLAGTTPDTNYVAGIFKAIQDSGHYISALGSQEMGHLPVGLVREINGRVYVIAIDSARFTPRGAYLNAYFKFTFPGTDYDLIFGGKDIAFTPGGIGAGGATKLVLLSDQHIGLNEHLQLVFPGDGRNYIEWDCNGFKGANLSGIFEFDPKWLTPEDPSLNQLKASLQVHVSDLSDIMAAIDLPAFHIAGLNDFSFKVTNAVVDLSDLANPAGLPASDALWRGFYLQELEVALPVQLGRPVLKVTDFMIDDQGISGTLSGKDLLPLGDANLGGWPISINSLSIGFSKNKLNGGSLGGQLQIPFLGASPVDYTAAVNMRGDNPYYSFALAITDNRKYECFAGEIILDQNSRIDVRDFVPEATLHGKLNINKGVLNIGGVAFQDLVLSTQAPYVHSGTFSLSSNSSKMAAFPISFDSIRLGIAEGKIAIGADVKMNFMNAADKGFSAATTFIVSDGQVRISDIHLSVAVMAFKMDGILTLFDKHPIYGNGFRGYLNFSLPGPIPAAKATAYFGSKDDYRYYHVDAYVGTNIPIPPMLNLTGLMGGLSYHMERPADFDAYAARNKVDEQGGLKAQDEIFLYTPTSKAGLGFMGGVSLALVKEMIVNVNASLEVQFGTDGAFRYAQFDGDGYVLHLPLKAPAHDDGAPVRINLKMRYDQVNGTFDAIAKTYINCFIKGTGESALHTGPDGWYFYIGRPSQMFNLDIAGLATVKTYFMTGSQVEDMPPLPKEVSDVLGDYNTMEFPLKNGAGLAFGAHFCMGFSFDYGVYGDFNIGAGADICLRDYGEARCKGSNEIIGINGWYASGQAYAYLNGELGMRVKVFGKKRGFPIARLAAAVLLQAKMPNPAWMKGTLGVKYSVLGGMVHGTANIKVELGSQCELTDAKELDLAIINDISPAHQSGEVSVFAAPQVAFNIPVGQAFAMLNNYDEVETYRVQLDGITLLHDKTIITGITEISGDGTAATLQLRDVLPATTILNVNAKVHIERKNGANWQVLDDHETRSATFTTGTAPDYIPWENVAYEYPVKGQAHFLPKESPGGYIKLKRGQPYLFSDDVSLNFNADKGPSLKTSFAYDSGMAQLNFAIPPGMMKEMDYKLSIIKEPGASTGNVIAGSNTSITASGDTTTITQNTLKGTATAAISKELLAYGFRTSRYNSFVEKMSAASNQKDFFDVGTGYISVIGQRWDLPETFDECELKDLVSAKANTNNSWLQTQIIPLIYANSTPPLDAVYLANDDYTAGRARMVYYVSCEANTDYHELLNSTAKLNPSSPFLGSLYPDLQRNIYYPVDLAYRLPGTNHITSSITKSIFYKL